jgi:hypothetical protein
MPSIAILPFDNISKVSDDVYFADGISEDIVTELSRYPDLFVVARNSSFPYRGKVARVTDAARELGVRNVLEEARRAGRRIRVNAQLIDAETRKHPVGSLRFELLPLIAKCARPGKVSFVVRPHFPWGPECDAPLEAGTRLRAGINRKGATLSTACRGDEVSRKRHTERLDGRIVFGLIRPEINGPIQRNR